MTGSAREGALKSQGTGIFYFDDIKGSNTMSGSRHRSSFRKHRRKSRPRSLRYRVGKRSPVSVRRSAKPRKQRVRYRSYEKRYRPSTESASSYDSNTSHIIIRLSTQSEEEVGAFDTIRSFTLSDNNYKQIQVENGVEYHVYEEGEQRAKYRVNTEESIIFTVIVMRHLDEEDNVVQGKYNLVITTCPPESETTQSLNDATGTIIIGQEYTLDHSFIMRHPPTHKQPANIEYMDEICTIENLDARYIFELVQTIIQENIAEMNQRMLNG